MKPTPLTFLLRATVLAAGLAAGPGFAQAPDAKPAASAPMKSSNNLRQMGLPSNRSADGTTDASGRVLVGNDQGIWRSGAPNGKLYVGKDTGVFAGTAARPARAASGSSFTAFPPAFNGGVSVATD